MGVAEAEAIVEFLAEIGAAVAVGIGEAPDGGDRINEDRVAFSAGGAGEREDADGDVEALGKRGDLAGATGGGIEIGENADGVDAVFGRLGRRGGGAEGDAVFGPVFIESRDDLVEGIAARGPWVKRGAGDPDATSGVEGDVERFLDSGLGGDELDFETGRKVEERLGLRG